MPWLVGASDLFSQSKHHKKVYSEFTKSPMKYGIEIEKKKKIKPLQCVLVCVNFTQRAWRSHNVNHKIVEPNDIDQFRKTALSIDIKMPRSFHHTIYWENNCDLDCEQKRCSNHLGEFLNNSSATRPYDRWRYCKNKNRTD